MFSQKGQKDSWFKNDKYLDIEKYVDGPDFRIDKVWSAFFKRRCWLHARFDKLNLEKVTIGAKEPWSSGLKSFGPIASAVPVTGPDRCSQV